ncbi:hypothetical protein GCM10010522_24900 [Kribbella solani]
MSEIEESVPFIGDTQEAVAGVRGRGNLVQVATFDGLTDESAGPGLIDAEFVGDLIDGCAAAALKSRDGLGDHHVPPSLDVDGLARAGPPARPVPHHAEERLARVVARWIRGAHEPSVCDSHDNMYVTRMD